MGMGPWTMGFLFFILGGYLVHAGSGVRQHILANIVVPILPWHCSEWPTQHLILQLSIDCTVLQYLIPSLLPTNKAMQFMLANAPRPAARHKIAHGPPQHLLIIMSKLHVETTPTLPYLQSPEGNRDHSPQHHVSYQSPICYNN